MAEPSRKRPPEQRILCTVVLFSNTVVLFNIIQQYTTRVLFKEEAQIASAHDANQAQAQIP